MPKLQASIQADGAASELKKKRPLTIPLPPFSYLWTLDSSYALRPRRARRARRSWWAL